MQTYSREANFFRGEKVEAARFDFFMGKTGASEKFAPLGIKLHVPKLE